jgi:long-chain acyl-CoA synthetase
MLFCFEGTPELPMAAAASQALAAAPGCREMVVLPVNPAETRRRVGFSPEASPIPGTVSFGELVAGQPSTRIVTPRRPDDTAVILYTSGTTGRPKGAELTHANVLLNSMVTWSLIAPLADHGPEAQNVMLITLPLFHSTGQIAQMTTTLYGGASIVLLPRFEPAAVLQTMADERVTFWTGVPTMYWMLLQHARANSVDTAPVAASLKACFSGGAPMPVEVMKAFEQTFQVRVLEGYGLSETSPVASFNHLDRPVRAGTVGQPLFGVEIRCVDDNDRPVPPGEPGEVVIRGHNVMKGYYKRPDDTAQAMRGGWFHTGDIGTFDSEGYLSIIDRKKDMILRGGYNVYPRELEEVLLTHPAVSLAAVIGVPHEKLGEEVKAFVVLKPGAALTEEELAAWCREQFAAYKCPRIIEFRSELPISATGKVLKRELRVPGA